MAKTDSIGEILLILTKEIGQGLELPEKTWVPYVEPKNGRFYGDIFIRLPDGIKAGKLRDNTMTMEEVTTELEKLGYSKVTPQACGLCREG